MNSLVERASPLSNEVLAWVCARQNSPPAASISICTHRAIDLARLGQQVADYLNEYDPESLGSWRTFDYHLVRQAAGDPKLREAIVGANPSRRGHVEEAPDFDLTAAGLGTLGHAILEGEACLTANRNNPSVFKVCLDCQPTGPHQERICDLWLNAPRFEPKSHVTSIGDSFLEWLSHR